MQMDLVIRFDFGLTVPWVTQKKDTLFAVAGEHRLVLRSSVPVQGEGLRTATEFTVKAGREIHFELGYENSFGPVRSRTNTGPALKRTETSWRKWASRSTYDGAHADAVERSLITLRALVFKPTGGMVAAPTTSLPEKPGGDYNWDYRYCWLRDATFALLGFIHAGYYKEAISWKNWLLRVAAGDPNQLQIMYGVTGERLLREWKVPWLPGYQNSRPVRIGNEASEQMQLDVYGELADTLFQARTSTRQKVAHFDLQFALLEHLRKVWREPDHGIWEIRGAAKHYTHSKVMAWVAFDRTIRDAERFKVKAPLAEWKNVRQQIHDDVCRLGFNSRAGSFVQYYGSKDVDASLLLLPLVGFLPPTDPRIVATVRMVEKNLMKGGFLLRYRTAQSDKHSVAGEGAFLLCSFWLADYYSLVQRRGAAQRLLNRLMKIRNDVGLLSEEFHLEQRRLVGNFPQALSHVALVNTIINLNTAYGPAHQRANSHQHGKARRVRKTG